MTIPTIHKHCRHSGTSRDHDDDDVSICSDAVEKLTPIHPRLLDPFPRLRRHGALEDYIAQRKKEKEARSVYVGNLDPRTSINDLDRLFTNFSPICTSTIKRNHTRALTAHGILEFKDKESMAKAMMLDGARVADRKIRVSPKSITHRARGCYDGRYDGRGHGRKGGLQEDRPGSGATLRTPFRNVTNSNYAARPY
ncbi:hypothetical protein BGZ93_001787 [Podila epicladia]|nr:hypothetical protein BGZ92_003630 [Podila epicladia]KAG0083461.1 hypothetical protein BGZ93_001787 [Podila epicladia]